MCVCVPWFLGDWGRRKDSTVRVCGGGMEAGAPELGGWGLYAGGKGSLLPRGCFRQKEGGCRGESALFFPMCG